MERRHPLVVNVDEVPPMESSKMFGRAEEEMGAYGATMRRLAAAAGGKQLGCAKSRW